MKPITIKWGPLTGGVYETVSGMLFADHYAMHVDHDYAELRIDRVKPVEGQADVYATDNRVSGIVLAENVPYGSPIIPVIYQKLTTMTAFQFITDVLMESGIDVDLSVLMIDPV